MSARHPSSGPVPYVPPSFSAKKSSVIIHDFPINTLEDQSLTSRFSVSYPAHLCADVIHEGCKSPMAIGNGHPDRKFLFTADDLARLSPNGKLDTIALAQEFPHAFDLAQPTCVVYAIRSTKAFTVGILIFNMFCTFSAARTSLFVNASLMCLGALRVKPLQVLLSLGLHPTKAAVSRLTDFLSSTTVRKYVKLSKVMYSVMSTIDRKDWSKINIPLQEKAAIAASSLSVDDTFTTLMQVAARANTHVKLMCDAPADHLLVYSEHVMLQVEKTYGVSRRAAMHIAADTYLNHPEDWLVFSATFPHLESGRGLLRGEIQTVQVETSRDEFIIHSRTVHQGLFDILDDMRNFFRSILGLSSIAGGIVLGILNEIFSSNPALLWLGRIVSSVLVIVGGAALAPVIAEIAIHLSRFFVMVFDKLSYHMGAIYALACEMFPSFKPEKPEKPVVDLDLPAFLSTPFNQLAEFAVEDNDDPSVVRFCSTTLVWHAELFVSDNRWPSSAPPLVRTLPYTFLSTSPAFVKAMYPKSTVIDLATLIPPLEQEYLQCVLATLSLHKPDGNHDYYDREFLSVLRPFVKKRQVANRVLGKTIIDTSNSILQSLDFGIPRIPYPRYLLNEPSDYVCPGVPEKDSGKRPIIVSYNELYAESLASSSTSTTHQGLSSVSKVVSTFNSIVAATKTVAAGLAYTRLVVLNALNRICVAEGLPAGSFYDPIGIKRMFTRIRAAASIFTTGQAITDPLQHLADAQVVRSLTEKVKVIIAESPLDAEQTTEWLTLSKLIEDALMKYDASVEFARGRSDCVGIFLGGKPGIGKSTIPHLLSASLTPALAGVVPVSPGVYCKRHDSAFFEGYVSQMIMDYSDPFVTEKVPEEIRQALLQTIQSMSCPTVATLPVSAIKDKQTTIDRSLIKVFSSNSSLGTLIAHATDREAVLRRFPFVYAVVPAPGVTILKTGVPDFNAVLNGRPGPHQLHDMIRFIPIDPQTDPTTVKLDQTNEHTAIDYATFATLVRDAVHNNFLNFVARTHTPAVPIAPLVNPANVIVPPVVPPVSFIGKIARYAGIVLQDRPDPEYDPVEDMTLIPAEPRFWQRPSRYFPAFVATCALFGVFVSIATIAVTVSKLRPKAELHYAELQMDDSIDDRKQFHTRGYTEEQVYDKRFGNDPRNGPVFLGHAKPRPRKQNLIAIEPIIRKNYCFVSVDGARAPALGIAQGLIFMNSHNYSYMLDSPTLLITFSDGTSESVSHNRDHTRAVYSLPHDIVLIDLKIKYRFRDILTHFATARSVAKNLHSVARVHHSEKIVCTATNVLYHSRIIAGMTEHLGVHSVQMPNKNGDCGSVYINNADSSITGIHIAGHTDTSYFSIITKDLIFRFLASGQFFPATRSYFIKYADLARLILEDESYETAEEDLPTPASQSESPEAILHQSDSPYYEPSPGEKFPPIYDMKPSQKTSFRFLRKAKNTELAHNFQNVWHPSPLSPHLPYPPTCAPAKMTSEAYILALLKTIREPRESSCDADFKSYCADLVTHYSTKAIAPGPITQDQAINGISIGVSHPLRPIDMTASPGPGFARNPLGRVCSSSDYFIGSPGAFEAGPVLQKEIDHIMDCLLRGENCTLLGGALKSETLPIEKVELKKTRLFCMENLAMKIVGRILCGTMIILENDQKYRGTGRDNSSVGINLESADAKLFLDSLNHGNDVYGSLDVKSCDSSHTTEEAGNLAYFCAALYRRSCKGRNVPVDNDFLTRQRNYIIFCVNPNVVIGQSVYASMMGLCSGAFITTFFNGFTIGFKTRNAIRRVLFDKKIMLSWSQFYKHVTTKHYGDDLVIRVDKRLCEDISLPEIAAKIKSWGYTLTHSMKGKEIPDWMPFEDCTFLRRQFVQRDGAFFCPILMDSPLESLHWRQGSPDKVDPEAMRRTVLNALSAIAVHGRDAYDHYAAIAQAAVDKTNLNLAIPSYSIMCASTQLYAFEFSE